MVLFSRVCPTRKAPLSQALIKFQEPYLGAKMAETGLLLQELGFGRRDTPWTKAVSGHRSCKGRSFFRVRVKLVNQTEWGSIGCQ